MWFSEQGKNQFTVKVKTTFEDWLADFVGVERFHVATFCCEVRSPTDQRLATNPDTALPCTWGLFYDANATAQFTACERISHDWIS
ncbi:MAG TPA: hypothetical protein VEN79_05150 [Terriglobia bacterium]|nr:hypothetical protein [Terriglobia bacterium]